MINTCGLRLLLVRAEQRSLGVRTPLKGFGLRRWVCLLIPLAKPTGGNLFVGLWDGEISKELLEEQPIQA
jgi:hypothetical protein